MDADDYTYVDGAIINVKDGTYFRSEDDFDHGKFFKRPDMKYTQLRRSSTETRWARLSSVGILFCLAWLAIGLPVLFYATGSDSWWNLILASVFTFAGIFLAVYYFIPRTGLEESVKAAPSIFQYSWYGYLPVPKATGVKEAIDLLYDGDPLD